MIHVKEKIIEPIEAEFAIYRQWYELASIDSPYIAKPEKIIEIDGKQKIVTKIPTGIRLDNFQSQFARNQLPFQEFFTIAKQLVIGLNHLNSANLIHGDLRPQNIFVDLEHAKVTLVGFRGSSPALSSRLPINLSDDFKMQLNYLAPEASGRFYRRVTYRSDYYSLGILLYELLAGELPFYAGDVSGILSCHLIKGMPDLKRMRTGLPMHLESILEKLCKKNPSQRFQNAKQILSELEAVEENSGVTPSMNELSALRNGEPCLHLPDTLDRPEELAQLKASLDRIENGEKLIAVVSGQSGLGKTKLTRELQLYLNQLHGRFISVAFEKAAINPPFHALFSIIDQLIRYAALEGEAKANYISENIKMIIDELKPDLRYLSNDVLAILRLEPLESPTSPMENAAAIRLTAQKIIGLMASANSPLVIMYDNCQWADQETIDFIFDMILDRDSSHVLVALTCQSQDAKIQIEKKLFAESFPTKLTEIHLAPMTLDWTKKTLISILGNARISKIAGPIHAISAGVPEHLDLIVKWLHKEGALQWEENRWQWDDALCLKHLANKDMPTVISRYLDLLEAKEVLLKCAGLGDSLCVEVFAHAFGKNRVFPVLEDLLINGILTTEDSLIFNWSHGVLFEQSQKLLSDSDFIDFAQKYLQQTTLLTTSAALWTSANAAQKLLKRPQKGVECQILTYLFFEVGTKIFELGQFSESIAPLNISFNLWLSAPAGLDLKQATKLATMLAHAHLAADNLEDATAVWQKVCSKVKPTREQNAEFEDLLLTYQVRTRGLTFLLGLKALRMILFAKRSAGFLPLLFVPYLKIGSFALRERIGSFIENLAIKYAPKEILSEIYWLLYKRIYSAFSNKALILQQFDTLTHSIAQSNNKRLLVNSYIFNLRDLPIFYGDELTSAKSAVTFGIYYAERMGLYASKESFKTWDNFLSRISNATAEPASFSENQDPDTLFCQGVIAFHDQDYNLAKKLFKTKITDSNKSELISELFYFLSYLRASNTKPKATTVKCLVGRMRRRYFQVQNLAEPFSYLVQAEAARFFNQTYQAEIFYERAIACARKDQNGYLAALTLEILAQYAAERDRLQHASNYAQEAITSYEIWGAHAFSRRVRERFKSLLLDQRDASLQISNGEPSPTTVGAWQTKIFSAGDIDLEVIMAASADIAKEINFESMILTTLSVLKDFTEADKAILILRESGGFLVRGLVDSENNKVTENIPLDTYGSISKSIVNAAINSSEPTIVDDIDSEKFYSRDKYFEKNEIKSIICLPIMQRNSIMGAIYLESIKIACFTPSKIKAITMLSSQIAINLENSRFITDLENQVNIRTAEVNEKTENIKTIFQNIEQGILTLDVNLVIGSDYSSYLQRLFGETDIRGQKLKTIFLDRTDLSEEQKNIIASTFIGAFGEDNFAWELNQRMLPTQVQFTNTRGEHFFLDLIWDTILDEDALVNQVMLIIRDITESVVLKSQARQKKEQIEIVSQVVTSKALSAHEFVATTKQQLQASRHNLADVNAIFRNIHTIKGNARTLGYGLISERVHEVESSLKTAQENENQNITKLVERGLKDIASIVDQYASVMDKVHAKREESSKALFASDIEKLINPTSEEIRSIYIRRFFKPLSSLEAKVKNSDALIHEEILIIVEDVLSELNDICSQEFSISCQFAGENVRLELRSKLKRSELKSEVELAIAQVKKTRIPEASVELSLDLFGQNVTIYLEFNNRYLVKS